MGLEPEILNSQAEWLAAIGEPTRLAIILALVKGVKTVTALAEECHTELVNVSHHISILRGAGVVNGERKGRFVRYSLVSSSVSAMTLELRHSSGIRVVLPLE
jgi:ArsR family transcriptional regulator